MSLWSKDKAPTFFPTAVQTEAGWVNPTTGEVLVAISELTDKAGGADVQTTRFEHSTYVQGAVLRVLVHFNEKVDVTVGATIEAAWSGLSGNVTLTAAAQTGVYQAIFEGVVPSEAGTLSVAAQTILGTIVDNDGGDPAVLTISASAGSAAGTRPVA